MTPTTNGHVSLYISPGVTVDGVVSHETAKAVKIERNGRSAWIPRAALRKGVVGMGGVYTATVADWFNATQLVTLAGHDTRGGSDADGMTVPLRRVAGGTRGAEICALLGIQGEPTPRQLDRMVRLTIEGASLNFGLIHAAEWI